MARFELDRRGFAQLLRSREIGAGCERIAHGPAAVIRGNTPVDTGETAASTHVEAANFGDRRGAWIVQDGTGAVATHFGNAHTRADHHATRGLT